MCVYVSRFANVWSQITAMERVIVSRGVSKTYLHKLTGKRGPRIQCSDF